MTSANEQTIRLSVSTLLFVVAGLVVIGMVGGMLTRFFLPVATPLAKTSEPVLTTVQQVTISPSSVAVKLVEQNQRSVLLMGEAGVGFVLTSDGLVVSPIELKTGTPVATDERGQALSLETVGRDTLYGLSYYRLRNAVLPPLDMRRDDPGVAAHLLLLGRSVTTFQPRATSYALQEYVLPADGGPKGWSRLQRGSVLGPVAVGSPLLDEEGKVGGVLLDATQGLALPVSQIGESLKRVVDNQRERDPLDELGITVRPTVGVFAPERPAAVGLIVTGVRPQAPAGAAGFKVGDIILGINQTAFSWVSNPVAALAAASRPAPLQILRNQTEQTLALP